MIKSDHFYYNKDAVNERLAGLQKALVDSLLKATDPTRCNGHTLWVVMGKGDWKWRKEWLRQPRSYANSNGLLCPRCLAGSPGKPWLDVAERFHCREDMVTAKLTSISFA